LYGMHKQIQSYFNIELLCNRPVWADVRFDRQKLTFILKTWLVQLSYWQLNVTESKSISQTPLLLKILILYHNYRDWFDLCIIFMKQIVSK
jgi:hypothetical protein